jgi:hypothetical protein
MPIDTDTVGSPGWWAKRLSAQLRRERPRLEVLRARLDGDAPMPEGAGDEQVYRRFRRKARTDFEELIVEAVRERMLVTAIQTGAEADADGDALAQAMWDTNRLPIVSGDVHVDMLNLGRGFASVGPHPDPTISDQPLIVYEDALQTITAHHPATQETRAGLKLFRDLDEGFDYAYVYLPAPDPDDETAPYALDGRTDVGSLWVARRAVSRYMGGAASMWVVDGRPWDWDPDKTGPTEVRRVPLVRFLNRRGLGEYEPHVDVIDRINHQVLQRMVIATMQAFRQRAAIDLPEYDEKGEKIDYNKLLAADPGALWLLPQGAQLWESGQVDLTPILSAVSDDVKHLAAVTRTPLATLAPDMTNVAAEGATFFREGLVFKTEDRISRAGEGWREVVSLGFETLGDAERSDRRGIRIKWASPERRSLAERADAASKASDLPMELKLSEVWGFDPEVVARALSQRAQDAALAAAFAPAAPVPAPARPVPPAPPAPPVVA